MSSLKTNSYPYIFALFGCFYSKDLYRSVVRDWRGIGVVYLSLVIALLLVIPSVRLFAQMNVVFPQTAEGREVPVVIKELIAKIPPMTLQNNQLSMDESVSQPVILTVPGSSAPLVIIDTSGNKQVLSEPEISFLVTRNFLLVRTSSTATEQIQWQQITQMLALDNSKAYQITPELLLDFLEYMAEHAEIIPLVFYLAHLVGETLTALLRALIFAGIGIFLVELLKAPLTFKPLMRISAVSCTPVFWLQLLSTIMGQNIFSSPEIIYALTQIVFLYIGIEANKTQGR